MEAKLEKEEQERQDRTAGLSSGYIQIYRWTWAIDMDLAFFWLAVTVSTLTLRIFIVFTMMRRKASFQRGSDVSPGTVYWVAFAFHGDCRGNGSYFT